MPIDLTRIRALCFDIDGTLSDTDDMFVLRLASWLRPGSFIFRNRDPRLFARWIVMRTESSGHFVYGLPDRLGFDHSLAHLGDLIYRMGLGRNVKPFLLIEQVKEMLQVLQPCYPMAIVSARGQRSTEAFLDQFELAPFFRCVATAQTCRYTKPYPDPILWAARQMGVRPAECLMIGDTANDIRAGRAAGAQTVGVLCGFGQEAELSRAGADLIIPTTAYLAGVLLPPSLAD